MLTITLLFQIIEAFEFINPQKVEKGMKGIALSSFGGKKIDTLEVEILGKIPGEAGSGEMIIAKLKGKIVEEAGIVAGMSGSPVYIEGKLLGAIASGWAFSKEPICGITPFTEMKKMTIKKTLGSSTFSPIKPILTVYGFPASSLPFLDSLPFNFSISQPFSGGKTKVANLTPGGVCGITIVSGDGNISAIGTITEIVGDTIFAFGHSAYGVGFTELPFCGGEVLSYLPSYYRSFNFAIPGEIIGKVIFDGNSGIKAIIGETPPMIDYKIKFGEIQKKYKVASEKSIFPLVSPFILLSNWIENKGLFGDATTLGNFKIWTSKGDIKVPFAISGTQVQYDLYKFSREIFLQIQENNLENVKIDSILVDLSIFPEIKEYIIKDLLIKKKNFKLGDTINLSVRLTRFRKSDTTVNFSFIAPDAPSDLLIKVSGRNEYLYYELERAPLNFQFNSFSKWREFINSLPAPDELILCFYKKGVSLNTEAGEFKSLPPSLRNIMEKRKRVTQSEMYLIKEEKIKFDGPLEGESSLSIEIRR
ncbi:MAG: SpoIVB peptidase S55 domain-containing protein [candidate division WOR-3 bacterium]